MTSSERMTRRRARSDMVRRVKAGSPSRARPARTFDMFNRQRPAGPARARPDAPTGDLRDPEYRHRYFFGDEPRHPLHDSRLATFLLFGAPMQR